MTKIFNDILIVLLCLHTTSILYLIPVEVQIVQKNADTKISCCCSGKSEKACGCKSSCCPMPGQSGEENAKITYSSCGSQLAEAIQFSIFKYILINRFNSTVFPYNIELTENTNFLKPIEYLNSIEHPPKT